MANIEELDKAIGDHEMWKSRLQLAIATRETDTPVETMQQDDQCAFGKWLYSPALASIDKASIHYQMVRVIHAEFHQKAAHVAALVLDREKEDAAKMLRHHYGEFAAVSTKLTQALMEWKKVLR